jgi:Toprim-like/CHC2 zinc finger
VNIKQARSIPLAVVLERMGAKLSRRTERDLWFLSPLREEHTPSLHVHQAKNVWYDFGEGSGGNSVDLVCAYLQVTGEDATVTDALRWLRNMTGYVKPSSFPREDTAARPGNEKGWVVKKVKPIEHPALIRYLQQRGIPLELAQQHLKEVFVRHPTSYRGLFALGFKNEDGGYELRNPFFKGCVAPKTVTFIRGAVPKPEAIHVFEGFMDFLSAAAEQEGQQLDGDVLVLNSVSGLGDAIGYIKGYGYRFLFSWLDNNPAGEKATRVLADLATAEVGLTHQAMNDTYAPHEDVNAWRMHRLGLTVS